MTLLAFPSVFFFFFIVTRTDTMKKQGLRDINIQRASRRRPNTNPYEVQVGERSAAVGGDDLNATALPFVSSIVSISGSTTVTLGQSALR